MEEDSINILFYTNIIENDNDLSNQIVSLLDTVYHTLEFMIDSSLLPYKITSHMKYNNILIKQSRNNNTNLVFVVYDRKKV